MRVLGLSFRLGVVGGNADVAAGHERRDFNSGKNRPDHRSVSAALQAEDGGAKVGGGHDEVHVEVVLGVEDERLRALLRSGPE